MRLLFLLPILLSGTVARQWPTAPKLLNIQINRCPTPTLYDNEVEEETLRSNPFTETGKVFLMSEFEDSVRMLPNESGTIQFFVIGNGSYNVVIQSDEKVLEGVHGNFTVKGGRIITLSFTVLQAVRETLVLFVIDNGIWQKTTSIYVSTKSLEPPRPPSLYSSFIFTEEELDAMAANPPTSQQSDINKDIEIPAADTNAVESDGSLKNITDSPSVIESIPTPAVEDSLKPTGKQNSIVLENITFNRISSNKATVYQSPSDVYNNVTISKFERGQIIFNVRGHGHLTVTIWSLVERAMAAKVMKVVNGYAAFSYRDGLDRVSEDKLLAKISNNLNEHRFAYLTVKRVL